MMNVLPESDDERGDILLATCLLDYFPNSLAAVARHSAKSNNKHNPGQSPHWARDKSTDHRNKIARHLIDAGGFDKDGNRHSVAIAWRGLALLEDELIAEGAVPGRNAVGSPSNSARQLYDETSAIASAQDANLYAVADIPETSPVADIDWNACFPTRAQLDAAATGKPPLEPSRICTPAELAYLASFGPNERVPPRDDAPPMFATLRDIPDSFTDSHGNRITRRHPVQAEADRLTSPEDRL